MRLVDDYPVPEPGPGEVLIKVAACAICGTDPEILADGWPNHPPYGEFIFGHEYTGTVAALGPGVTEMAVGDPVAVEPHKGCGVCANCRDGLYTTCLNYGRADKGHRHYGFSTNGGYAEYACNHVNSVYRVPTGMPLDAGNADHHCGHLSVRHPTHRRHSRRRDGGCFGPCPIGLMAVTMARLLGAGTIILTGTRPERLEMGRGPGATCCSTPGEENVVERVFGLTGGVGASAVPECAGTSQAAADAVEMAKKNGRVALIAMYKEPAPLSANKIVQWNITIAGSKAEGERSIAQALDLLGRSTVNLSPLITHRFSRRDPRCL